MGISLLGLLSAVFAVGAWLLYRAFSQAVRDQCELANLLMAVLTSDNERTIQRTKFLDFVVKSKYADANALSATCTRFLISIAKHRAPQIVPANRDIYWAMSRNPAMFFVDGDLSKPRRGQ